MLYRLEYTECQNLGDWGWILTHRNRKRIGTEEFFTTKDARVLAHDLFEHDYSHPNENIDEIKALGSIIHNRERDFYNQMGNFSGTSDLGEQVYSLICSGEASSLSSSRRSREHYTKE